MLTEAEKHRPNKDAILPCGRLAGADSLSGRPWDWDKYCSVIESCRLFPVGREKRRGQNIQPWIWTSHKDMYGFLTVHSIPLKKNTFVTKLAPHCTRGLKTLFPQRETRGPAPSSPPLLHKPAPCCQICLKFGCVKQSAGPAEEVAATQTNNLR